MRCRDCTKAALFICHCLNITLCEVHLGKHLRNKCDHKYESLFRDIERSKKSILDLKLKKWISSLEALKNSVSSQTIETIEIIQSRTASLISKINSFIQQFEEIISNSKFLKTQMKEIESFSNSELVVNEILLKPLLEEFNKRFSEEMLVFITDPIKFNQIIYNRFLKTHNGGFNCLAISNDGQILVTGSEDTSIRIWDMKTRTQISCLTQHQSDIRCLVISQDCNYVASGSLDRSVILWDIKNKCCKNVYYGHSGAVYAVAFSDDSSLIVSGGSGNEIIVWNTYSTLCLMKIITTSIVRCGIVSSNMFYAGVGGTLEVWDIISYKKSVSLNAHSSAVKSIALTKNKNLTITCSNDKQIKIWETSSNSLYGTLSGHTQGVKSVAVTSDDKHIISGSSDCTIIIWSIESLSKLHKFTFHKDDINTVINFKDFIISASRDSRVGISRLSSRLLDSFLVLQPFKFGSLMIKNDIIAFGSGKNVLICTTGKNRNEFGFQGHKGLVQATCISNEMKFLVSSSIGKQNNLIVWDLKKKEMISVLSGHEESVFCVDISSDEQKVVSGDADSKVRLWNLSSLQQEFLFEGHSDHVYSVKFTFDQRFACSAGADKRVFVWDIQNKSVYACLEGHIEIIWKVLITGDDKFIVSCDNFHGVRVWNLDEKRLMFEFKDRNESKEWISRNSDLEFDLMKYLV